MSSDLERRLRDARAALPEPDVGATRHARERALAAAAGRRKVRPALLVGVGICVAVALGTALGTLVAPSGTAAREPVGLGFLPEEGWYVLQSGARASTSSPAVAIASNVPFAPDDDIGGAAESSALPYSTLLRLPRHGVVIAVTFTPRGEEPWRDGSFVHRSLPLRLPTTIPRAQFGTQLRPEEPLGVHAVSVAVNRHNLDLRIYFGMSRPTAELIAVAQRQLDGLMVRPRPVAESAVRRPLETTRVTGASAILDRTYVCAARFSGGIPEIEARANAGLGRRGSSTSEIPQAAISTGTDTGSVTTVLDNDLAWVTAGNPSAHATIVPDPFPGVTYPTRTWGTIAVNRTSCKPTSKRIPLAPGGLTGGAVTALGDHYDCATPRRVLLRVRAVLESQALKQYRNFLRSIEPAREAQLAVRTEKGKPIAYAEVFQSGKARLFTAQGCGSD